MVRSGRKRLETLTKEDIQKLHELVKPDIDPRTGKQKKAPKTGNPMWKRGGPKAAAEHFGVRRETITQKWLVRHPTPVIRQRLQQMKPKEVQEFEETSAWTLIQGHNYEGQIKNVLLQLWNYTGKIDPVTWNVSHYKSFREPRNEKGNENPFYSIENHDIIAENAVNLRRFIRLLDPKHRPQLIEIMKNVKKGDVKRKEWYLNDPEIISLIQHLPRLDVVIYTMLALESGSRPNSMCGNQIIVKGKTMILPNQRLYTPERIDKKDNKNVILRWENKKSTWARAKHQLAHIELLERYIRDKGIQPNEMIFPYDPRVYSNIIKKAGKKAGIKLFSVKGTGAYTLRHTFATQALDHNVSLESVMEQGGWIGSDTLQKYYAGLKESKLDLEFFDRKDKETLTWRQWISQFTPYYYEQYDKLIREYLRTDGIKRVPPSERVTGKPINWGSINAWIKSDKTSEATKKSYRKAVRLRKEGKKDPEIKRIMGWKQ